MPSSTVPISETALQLLDEITRQTGQTAPEVLEKALDAYRRQLFFDGLRGDFEALKADPKAWAEELEERKLWEATLMDGLDPQERWTEDGHCLNMGL